MSNPSPDIIRFFDAVVDGVVPAASRPKTDSSDNQTYVPSTHGAKTADDNDELNEEQQTRKLEKRLRSLTGKAVVDFNMIEAGDRVMVCLSGGKDSYTMLEMLLHLQRVAPISFSLCAVNLDQKQPGFPEHVLPEYLEKRGVDYHLSLIHI